MQVQNIIFSGDLALENIVSLKDPGYNGETKKLLSPLSGEPRCKLVLQSGAGPLRDSMVGDFKHSRKYETIIILSKKRSGQVDNDWSPNTSNYLLSSSSIMSSYRPKLGFGRVDGSFPPKLHKPHSSGKPATSYCSKWGMTWLRAWARRSR